MAQESRTYFGIKKEEFPFSLLMGAYFFLVITSFWVMKPIKKSLFIDYYKSIGGFDFFGWHMLGSQAEQIAKVMNMVVAAGAVAVFTLFSRRMRRQQLTFVFSLVFIVAFLGYFFLLRHPHGFTVWSFYLFGDLFSTLMVSTFYAFLNDSVTADGAKRTYGLVGFGGVAGGAVGALSVAALINRVSAPTWMLILTGTAVVIIAIAAAAGRMALQRNTPIAAPQEQAPASKGSPALEGARLVFSSRYLLAIVGIVGLYEMVSTIMDFQFTSSVEHYVSNSTLEHFSRVFTITNILSMVIQLFFTSLIMTRFGVGVALLVLPIAALSGSAAFVLAPSLITGSILNTADNAFSYSINQSAKESLYVPTTRDEKYKAKAFIDMFVQRLAKSVGVGLNLILTAMFSSQFTAIPWLSILSVMILSVWIVAARFAGKRFDEIAAVE